MLYTAQFCGLETMASRPAQKKALRILRGPAAPLIDRASAAYSSCMVMAVTGQESTASSQLQALQPWGLTT